MHQDTATVQVTLVLRDRLKDSGQEAVLLSFCVWRLNLLCVHLFLVPIYDGCSVALFFWRAGFHNMWCAPKKKNDFVPKTPPFCRKMYQKTPS